MNNFTKSEKMKTVDQKNYNSEGTSTPAVKYCYVEITKKKPSLLKFQENGF